MMINFSGGNQDGLRLLPRLTAGMLGCSRRTLCSEYDQRSVNHMRMYLTFFQIAFDIYLFCRHDVLVLVSYVPVKLLFVARQAQLTYSLDTVLCAVDVRGIVLVLNNSIVVDENSEASKHTWIFLAKEALITWRHKLT